jgi:hypothetical protein
MKVHILCLYSIIYHLRFHHVPTAESSMAVASG